MLIDGLLFDPYTTEFFYVFYNVKFVYICAIQSVANLQINNLEQF